MKIYAEITGWGKCLPPAIMTNDDLATFLETSDEWIRTRTGIEERRVSAVGTSKLATVAGRNALAAAGVDANDIDLILVGTCTPDEIIPNVASAVQRDLGCKFAAAFDLNAACSSFLYGMHYATQAIRTGVHKKVLIIGAERLTRILDWTQRESAVLFGDGAGAMVLEASETESGLLASHVTCDADARDVLALEFGMSFDRFNFDGIMPFNFVGQEIFKRAVKGMNTAVEKVFAETGLTTDDIDSLIPHQANKRLIDYLAKMCKVPEEKTVINIQKYGNTSSATLPIAFCEAVEQGIVKPGDTIVSAVFGGGLTCGAGIIKWGQRVTPIRPNNEELPSDGQTALDLILPMHERTKQAWKQRGHE
ncbi:ketoacyl-ACP synthase III [Pseudidiomarina sp. 1APP75-27a]|uniref:ketoacyl-ACP synthase III n=1 Tax=Pseudidiomarina terrestris TaxID=2820060 RepID=UPI002651B360|nr:MULTISPECIES: ketoacyl-ACP synthase III [unclassified Pseudidiomarina]MDN7137525.1 ketoacyl-ACP synthase III [Pseudidiomarina sp. 1ASP75-14]MEA3587365.1 ketoacyl-ACP synthase III [Pseudidiomarina sp. 1APP75-27a]